MLFLEVRRLYLEYRLVNEEMDQYKVCIDVVAEEDNPKNDFNLLETRMIYLGEIAGAPQKYVRINLRKLKKHTSPEEKLEIGAEYLSRSAYSPSVIKIWGPDMFCGPALGWLHRGYGDGCLSWVTISTLGHLQVDDRIDRMRQYEIM